MSKEKSSGCINRREYLSMASVTPLLTTEVFDINPPSNSGSADVFKRVYVEDSLFEWIAPDEQVIRNDSDKYIFFELRDDLKGKFKNPSRFFLKSVNNKIPAERSPRKVEIDGKTRINVKTEKRKNGGLRKIVYDGILYSIESSDSLSEISIVDGGRELERFDEESSLVNRVKSESLRTETDNISVGKYHNKVNIAADIKNTSDVGANIKLSASIHSPNTHSKSVKKPISSRSSERIEITLPIHSDKNSTDLVKTIVSLSTPDEDIRRVV